MYPTGYAMGTVLCTNSLIILKSTRYLPGTQVQFVSIQSSSARNIITICFNKLYIQKKACFYVFLIQ